MENLFHVKHCLMLGLSQTVTVGDCIIPSLQVGAFQMALVVKNLPASAGDIRDVGSIPGLGRSPGEGNGNPLQYSCQDNRVDRGAWWVKVHGIVKVGHDLATKPPPPHHCR